MGRSHARATRNDNSYRLHTPAEWSSYITPILNAGYPVAATECGSHDCKADYINSFMAFCDRAGVSYLPFGWNPWGVLHALPDSRLERHPDSAYGQAIQQHFLAQAAATKSPSGVTLGTTRPELLTRFLRAG